MSATPSATIAATCATPTTAATSVTRGAKIIARSSATPGANAARISATSAATIIAIGGGGTVRLNRFEPGQRNYFADRYYRDGRYFQTRRLTGTTGVYRGGNGQYYCRRNEAPPA